MDTIDVIDTIEFRNVSFAYPQTSDMVLTNVSFSVKHGQQLVLVGENGTGKSTIIKLLLRFYEVSSGTILINDKNIHQYAIDSLRRCFTVYFQEALNYAFTIRENIALSDREKEPTDISICSVLQKCNGMGILQKAKLGMESSLYRQYDENAVELSGGEMQKLALARTFFRNASVMILDEPSSALDPQSEHEINESLQKDAQNRITIIMSHRLSSASQADHILVLEKGSVVESGSHEQLMALNRKYCRLYSIQADRYKT